MNPESKKVYVSSSHFKSLNNIDYIKMFPKTAIGIICRFQILLCALGILAEIVWVCNRRPYDDHIHLTGIGIWCGIFGIMSGSFGLWIRSKPTNCNIKAFMVLCVINGIFYFAYLAISIVKATTISNGVVDDYALRKTLIVIHFIIGIAQEVLLITSIIYACKATCFTPVAIENTYFLKPIINKNGEEIFQLVPAEIDMESEQLRHDQTKHAILENCENGVMGDETLESSSITKDSALIGL